MHDMNPMHNRAKHFLLVVLVAILIITSFLIGFFVAFRTVGFSKYTQFSFKEGTVQNIPGFDATLYAEVFSSVKNSYVDRERVDDKKLFYGALRGMVSAVGDPYTSFFDPESLSEFNEELAGTFEGIGAEIGMRNDHLVVIAPLVDSPAERSGLRAGDIILAIDDQETIGVSLDEAITKIRGKAGTIVKLTIYRDGDGATTKEISITRARIVIPAVRSEVSDGVAVISIYNFHNESEKQFIEVLIELSKQDIKGIVIDLRNNPGGYLDKAVSIASAWVPEGKTIVREVYNDAALNENHTALRQVKVPRVPTVVLVNQGSASASEILAGALQDYGLAIIVGEKTYGKGSVQDVRTFSDGSGLKITIAQWLTPSGRVINDEGIEPDVQIPLTVEDVEQGVDPQLEKAKEIIANNGAYEKENTEGT